MTRNTGSALANELIARRNEIKKRRATRRKNPQATQDEILQSLGPGIPLLPAQSIKSLDDRLAEVDKFSNNLSVRTRETIKWNIRKSAIDCMRPKEPIRRMPTIARIQHVVAVHFNISVDDLISRTQTVNIVRPRQVAMYLCRQLTVQSAPEIGRRFGGRNYTTVVDAEKRITCLIESFEELSNKIIVLRRMLES